MNTWWAPMIGASIAVVVVMAIVMWLDRRATRQPEPFVLNKQPPRPDSRLRVHLVGGDIWDSEPDFPGGDHRAYVSKCGALSVCIYSYEYGAGCPVRGFAHGTWNGWEYVEIPPSATGTLEIT